ncbi:uncharacterized protein LOC108166168 [Poecilia reticulata]|uniref:uncharacterized protein LOC108166168 n=1 Tax=Poecilia reticulata TaxID=8081 RepID=UPI0007EBF273|nr:PREDICTED: uncharacterized protein LOC108166168 [Poecilia reticulata]
MVQVYLHSPVLLQTNASTHVFSKFDASPMSAANHNPSLARSFCISAHPKPRRVSEDRRLLSRLRAGTLAETKGEKIGVRVYVVHSFSLLYNTTDYPSCALITIYIIIHPDIYIDRNGRKHDMMLLKLPRKTTVQPIKLPDCPDTLLLGTKVQIAGYGPARAGLFNKRIDHTPHNLQGAEFKIDKHERLEKVLEKDNDWHRHQTWYSVRSSKKDISFGDCGGGVIHQAIIGDLKYALCSPSGFMDVCAYKQWIDDTIH